MKKETTPPEAPRKKRGRPKKPAGEEEKIPASHVAVRLDQPTIQRVRAFLPVMSTPWREATLSDVFRAVILRGLEAFEGETARGKTKDD